jgi:putative ABC transport system ATP-binding protein
MKKKESSEVIRLKDVFKIYDMGKTKVYALNGLDVEINDGEFVAIMGPSGSGKSTAMNLVGSLDTPSRGKVFLDSLDISKLHESELAQIRGKKIGFIFQSFNLIPNLTAKGNIMLPMMFQGIPVGERE